jgi:hypothetical protein
MDLSFLLATLPTFFPIAWTESAWVVHFWHAWIFASQNSQRSGGCVNEAFRKLWFQKQIVSLCFSMQKVHFISSEPKTILQQCIYYYWKRTMSNFGMLQHIGPLTHYPLWLGPFHLHNMSSPVGWGSPPSGVKGVYQGLFLSVNGVPHCGFTYQVELEEPKVEQADGHLSRGRKNPK